MNKKVVRNYVNSIKAKYAVLINGVCCVSG